MGDGAARNRKARRHQATLQNPRMGGRHVIHEETCVAAPLPALTVHLAWRGSADAPRDVAREIVRDHVAESVRQLSAVVESADEDFAVTLERTLRLGNRIGPPRWPTASYATRWSMSGPISDGVERRFAPGGVSMDLDADHKIRGAPSSSTPLSVSLYARGIGDFREINHSGSRRPHVRRGQRRPRVGGSRTRCSGGLDQAP